MNTDLPKLPSTSGAPARTLMVAGVVMLAAGFLYPGKEAMTATTLIVIGAGMLAMGILFPHIRELEIGPGGFRTKIVESKNAGPVIGLQARDLTRFAYLASGDHEHARELVEEALARGGKRYRARATAALDISTLRTLVALLDTASERRWLSGHVGAANDGARGMPAPTSSTKVIKALQSLSFRQRVVFLLHADWSLRSDQIAEIIESPLDSVKDDISEAREVLLPHMNTEMADVE